MIGYGDIGGFHGAAGMGANRPGLSRRGNKAGPERRARPAPAGDLPTVRDFTVSPALRLAHAVASAAIVRDVAALGAVILFATMVAMVLVGMDPGA